MSVHAYFQFFDMGEAKRILGALIVRCALPSIMEWVRTQIVAWL